MATKYNSPCIKKAGDDEPLFVLRSQDISSPLLILEWIKVNFETCTEEKLQAAFKTAMEMRNWPNRKHAD